MSQSKSSTNQTVAAAQAAVSVPAPEQGQHVSVEANAGGKFDFAFDPSGATVAREGADLNFELDNGGTVTITDFFKFIEEGEQEFVMPDGTAVAAADLLTNFNIDMTPAAGPSASSSSGSGEYSDDAGNMLNGIDRLGMTDPFFWASSNNEVRREDPLGVPETPGGSFTMGVTSPNSAGFSNVGVYEDWKPTQNVDGDAAPEAPAKIDFQFQAEGSTEVTEVRLTGFPVGTELRIGNPDGSQSTITITSPGQIVSLTADQLQVQGVYVYPPRNSDGDMNITAQVDLRANSSGMTETINGQFTIVVDAVADKPVDVDVNADYGANTAAQAGETTTLKLNAKFGDFEDGSETHYMVVHHDNVVAGVEGPLPDGLRFATPEELADFRANTGGEFGDDFTLLVVDDNKLDANGNLSQDITVRLHEQDVAKGDQELTVKVDAVAVEGAGRNTPAGSGTGELTADNNVSSTDASTTVKVNVISSNVKIDFDASRLQAYEDNMPKQNEADPSNENAANTSAGEGAEIRFTGLADASQHEVVDKLVITIECTKDDNGNYVEGTVSYNGPFTTSFDPATGHLTVTLGGQPGQTVDLSEPVRYQPAQNNNADDIKINFDATVRDTQSNEVQHHTGDGVIVIDAVADKPTDVTLKPDYGQTTVGGNQVNDSAAIAGEQVDLQVKTEFGDYKDGSESHYITIESGGLTGIDAGSLPAGMTLATADEIAEFKAQTGLTGDIVLIKVDNSYLQAHGGKVDITLKGNTVDVDKDSTFDVTIKGVAVEGEGLKTATGGSTGEIRNDNNVSVTEEKTEINVSVIKTKDVTVDADNSNLNAYEDNKPAENVGDSTQDGGANIRFSGLESGDNEVIDVMTITIHCQQDDNGNYVQGTVSYPGTPGVDYTVNFNSSTGELTVTIPNFNPNNAVNYKPGNTNSDADIDFDYKLTVRDEGSNQSKDFSGSGTIVVDAVADKPVDVDVTGDAINAGKGGVIDGGKVTIEDGWASQTTGKTLGENKTATVEVTGKFDDFKDGSEEHFVIVKVPAGLTLDESSLPKDSFEKMSAEDIAAHNAIPGAPQLDPNGTYYTIKADGNIQSDGTFKQDIKFNVPEGSKSGDYTVETIYVSHEKNTSGGETTADNNWAFDQGKDDITVNGFDSTITVKTGWAYEGADGNKDGGDPVSIPGTEAGGAPTTIGGGAGQGAAGPGTPIQMEFHAEGGETLGFVTLTISDSSAGKFYDKNGNLIEYMGGGSSIKVNAGMLERGEIFFRPNPGYSDKDLELKYSVEVKESDGSQYAVNGEVPLVIDAVADQIVIKDDAMKYENGSTGTSGGNGVLEITVDSSKVDPDGSEYVYVVLPKGTIADVPGHLTGKELADFEKATGMDTDGSFVVKVKPEDLSNGTVKIPVQFDETKSDIHEDIDYKTVVVEGQGAGNSKDLWEEKNGTDDKEYDFTNNVSVSDGSVTVDVSVVDGAWSVKTTDVSEDYSPNKHVGVENEENPATDGHINLSISGDTAGTEQLQSVTLTSSDYKPEYGTVEYQDGSGNWHTAPAQPNGDGSYSFVIPGTGKGDGIPDIRYCPAGNDDHDFTFKADGQVKDTANGTTGKFEANGKVEVDAVADKPTDVTNDTAGTPAEFGKSVSVTVEATFGDTKDGSESHFMLVQVPKDLTLDEQSLKDAGFAESEYTKMTGQELLDYYAANGITLPAGVTIDANSTYYKLAVDKHLDADGKASFDIDFKVPAQDDSSTAGHLDQSSGDYKYDGSVIGWAQEKPSDTDTNTDNNNAFTQGDMNVIVTGFGEIKVGTQGTYEDLDPNQHVNGNAADPNYVGPLPADAGHITFTYDTVWEEVTGITLTFNGSPDGKVQQYDPATGKWVDLQWNGNQVTTDHYDAQHPIRYVPGANSDADASFKWSVTVKDLNNGQSHTTDSKAGEDVTVVVDAVADKPTVEVEGQKLAGGGGNSILEVSVDAHFPDTDGSETHTIVITVPAGWVPEGYNTASGYTGPGTYDPAKGTITIDVGDKTGDWDGKIKFEVPKDDKSSLKVDAIAEEKASVAGGGEITDKNNVATDTGTVKAGDIPDVEFKAKDGSAFEDSKPHYNEYDPTSGINTEEHVGMSFLNNPKLPDGVTVKEITVDVHVPGDASQDLGGSFNYGDKGEVTVPYHYDSVSGKYVLDVSGIPNFDASKLHFQPEGNYNGKIELDVTVKITDGNGMASVIDAGTSKVNVDAVATTSDEVKAGAEVSKDESSVELSISTKFDDNDGSETHYVLVEAKDGWDVLGFPTEYYNVGPGGAKVLCYVIDVTVPQGKDVGDSWEINGTKFTLESKDGNDFVIKAETGGTKYTIEGNTDGSIDVKLNVTPPAKGGDDLATGSLVVEHPEAIPDVKDNTQPSENLGNDYFGNNVSLRPGGKLEWSTEDKDAPSISVGANWAFENNQIPAGENECELKVTIENFQGGKLDNLELDFDFQKGTPGDEPAGKVIWKDGDTVKGEYTLDEHGKVNIPGYDGKGTLVYQPSGSSDKDITVNAKGSGQNLDGKNDSATSEGTIHVDAVADKTEFASDGTLTKHDTNNDGSINPGESFSIDNLQVKFTDLDGSETHSLLLEAKPGWTYTVKAPDGSPLVDSKGNPIEGELVQGADGKMYWKYDLDDTKAFDGKTGLGTVDVDVKLDNDPFILTGGKGGDIDSNFNFGARTEEKISQDGNEGNWEKTTDNNQTDTTWQWGTGGGTGGNGGLGPINPIPPTGPGTGEDVTTEWVHETPGGDNQPVTGDHADVKIPGGSTVTEWDGTITLQDGNTIYKSDGKGHVEVSTDGGKNFTPHTGDVKIPDGQQGSYQPPKYSDEDTTIKYTDGDNKNHTINVIVDATAQAPNVGGATADYNEQGKNTESTQPDSKPWTAEDPDSHDTYIKVNVGFPDTDGSEDHYILIEAKAGWTCEDARGTVMGPDGKLYFQISTDKAIHNDDGTYTVKVQPPHINDQSPKEGWDEGKGAWHYELGYGGMSVEKGSDKEIDYSDNTSVVIGGGTVGIDYAPADSGFELTANGPGYEGNIKGYDAAGNEISGGKGVELSFEGSMGKNDVMMDDVVIKLSPSGEGKLYDAAGNELAKNGDGDYVIPKGSFDPSSPIYYKPNEGSFSHDDVKITWTGKAQDTTSGDTQNLGGSVTVVIDNVAHKPDVEAGAVDKNGDPAGVIITGKEVTIHVKATFQDGDDGSGNEGRYLFIEQIPGVEIDLSQFTQGYQIMPIDGNPANGYYYRIPVTDSMKTGSDGKTTTYEYDFTVKPNDTVLQGDGKLEIKVGGVVDERVGSTATDKELEAGNNRVTSTETVEVSYGKVTTGSITAQFNGKIGENNANGTDIKLIVPGKDGKPNSMADDAADKNNEVINETSLTFHSNGAGGIGGADGEIVGSVIYDGKVFYIYANADGKTGTVDIDFGPNGYDSSKSMKVVWGEVKSSTPGVDGGTAQMSDGKYDVSHWNHAATGDITVNSDSKLTDVPSGDTGSSKTESTVGTDSAADAPTDLKATDPGDVSAGTTTKVTIEGKFADVDGSEDHFLLVEAKTGWTASVNGTNLGKVYVNGAWYFKVPVSSTDPNPKVDVDFKIPAGETAGPGSLKYGGMSQERGDTTGNGTATIINPGDTIDYDVKGVNTSKINLTTEKCDEDGQSTLKFELVDKSGNPSGESLSRLEITVPKGGMIQDAQGNWHTSTGGKIVLTGNQINNTNGEYEYKPAPNASGDMGVSFNGTVQNGTASQGFGGNGKVVVNPVTDQPTEVINNVDAGLAVQAGHTANVNIKLDGKFGGDNDGSENHFFAVKLPAGVTTDKYEQITDPNVLAKLGDGPWYKVPATDGNSSSSANAQFKLDGSYDPKNGDKITVVAVAQEKNAPTDVKVSGEGTVNIPEVPELNLGPDAKDEHATMDTLRDKFQEDGGIKNTEGKGKLDMTDADGDKLTVTGMKDGNGDSVTAKGDGSFEVKGEYGTLRVDADGSYTYTLNPGASATGQEKFEYTVSDGHGGSDSANIVIDLSDANNTPTITGDLTGKTAGGASNTDTASGKITWGDLDGDTVTVTGSGHDGAEHGFKDGALVLAGEHGTLTINSDGSYTYDLYDGDEHQYFTGQDKFTIKADDGLGGVTEKDLVIDVKPVNHAPEVGTIEFDYGNDPNVSVNGDVLKLNDLDKDSSHVGGQDVKLVSVTVDGHVYTVPSDGSNVTITGKYGNLTINSKGEFQYNKTDPGNDMTDRFEITVKDAGGLEGKGNLDIKMGDGGSGDSLVPGSRMAPASQPFMDSLLAAALVETQNDQQHAQNQPQQPEQQQLDQHDQPAAAQLKPLSEDKSESDDALTQQPAHTQDAAQHAPAAVDAHHATDQTDQASVQSLTAKAEGDVQTSQSAPSEQHTDHVYGGNGESVAYADASHPAGGGILSETHLGDIIRASGDGGEVLTGTTGDDTIIGGAGNDIIHGGAGNDVLTGGDGADSFVWNNGDLAEAGGSYTDIITDFNPNEGDEIDLTAINGLMENSLQAHYNEQGNLEISFESDGATQNIVLDGYTGTPHTDAQDALQQLLTEQAIKLESGGQ